MSVYKIFLDETITKRLVIKVDTPSMVNELEMDKICDELEKHEFSKYVIKDLRAKGYKVSIVEEGPEIGEVKIDELEEILEGGLYD